MEIMVLDHTDDIEMLRTIGDEWAANAHGTEYGLPIDVNTGLATMQRLSAQPDGDVLVLVSDMRVVGFMGLSYRSNHVGPGRIANECCFYVAQSARSGGIRIKNAAKKLAKSKGCDFVIWNASRIAGDADRSGKFYERGGAVQFETSYLEKL